MDITFVREHIKGLQDKVKKVDSPDMILHSAALGGALSLTNGTRGDIPSISDQMAILTAVVVGDKLGENARHFASCPVIQSSTRDKDGRLVMPWPTRDEIRVLMEARGLKEAEAAANASGFDVNLPWMKKFLSFRGRASLLPSAIVAVAAGAALWILAANYASNKAFAANVKQLLANVKTQEAVTARGAVARSEKLLKAVKDKSEESACPDYE
jgi:hypothetical protein